MEPHKTPQRDRKAITLNKTKVNSTPQHHGTAEASSHLNSLTRATVSPIIAQDLSKAASVKVDDMLRFFVTQIILDKTKPPSDYLDEIRAVVKPIAPRARGQGAAQNLHTQLTTFLDANAEAEGYGPWVKFTNTALLLLKEKQVDGLRKRNIDDDIIMQRIDPSCLVVAGRKPDIAFLKLKRAQALLGTKDDWDMIAGVRAAAKPPSREMRSKREHIDRGPDDAGLPYFDWSDVLFFSEHKFPKNSPKSLCFEDLLVSEGLREPLVSPRSQKRSVDEVPGSGSNAGRPKSQKPSAHGTASSSSKNSQHISLSCAIAKDAASVPEALRVVEPEKIFTVQAGEYGLGRLNSWFGMTHSLGCLVLGSLLYICWFDRGGLIGSSAIDVSRDSERYIVLLFILQRFKDAEWGRLEALDHSTIHIQNKALKVDTGDILHKPWGIIGRNTTVIGCSQQPPTSSQPNASAPSSLASDVSPIYGTPPVNHRPKQGDGTPAHDNEPPIYDQTRPASHVAAEDSIRSPSSADESQTKEQTKKDEEGHADGVKKNSFVIKFSWVEETRTREHEVYHRINEVAHLDDDVKGHVPELVAHHAFKGTSTSVIREELGVPTRGSRLLVAIVFKRLDGTIRELSGAEYWKVYWETFLCHYGLWMWGVYHRDISDGNLMYKKDDTGKVIGVLGDFDLSSLLAKPSTNTERTGTVPFMALDLLTKKALAGEVPHDYGHEAEAYFWVGVYDTACYNNGRTVNTAPPAQWNSLNATTLREKKLDYLDRLEEHEATASQEDVWNGLSYLEGPLERRRIFRRSKTKKPVPDTLDVMDLTLPSRRKPLDPLDLDPKSVRDEFLRVRRAAEGRYPSLLNQTSTSSSYTSHR